MHCSASRTANFRKGRGLDRTRGSYKALVTEIQLGILRGELAVPQKITAPGLAARGAFLFPFVSLCFPLFLFPFVSLCSTFPRGALLSESGGGPGETQRTPRPYPVSPPHLIPGPPEEDQYLNIQQDID